MGKRLRVIFFTLIVLTAVSALSVYTFRNFLLEALIGIQLRKQNLPLRSIEVLDVSLHGFQMKNLIAGKNKEFHINQVRVAWNLYDLFTTTPISIEVSSLIVNVRIDDKQMHFIHSPPNKSFDLQNFDLPWLPILSLKDSAVYFQSAAGDGAIALSGGITPAKSGGHVLNLDVVLSGSLVQSNVKLTAAFDSQGNIQGGAVVTDGMLQAPGIGIASFSGSAVFRFAALQLQNAQTEFVLSDITLGNKVLEDSGAEITIDQVTFAGDILGFSDFLTGKLDVDIRNGQWLSESMQFQQLAIFLPLQIDLGRTGWYVGLRNPTTAMLGKIKTIYPVRFPKLLELSITQAEFELIKHTGSWSLQHNVVMTSDSFTLWAQRTAASAMETQIRPGKIILTGKVDDKRQYQGQINMVDTALLLSQLHLKTKDILITADWNNEKSGNAAGFSIKQLQHLAAQPLFAPLSLTGSIRSTADDEESLKYELNLKGGIPGLPYIHITGNHAPKSNEGMLSAELVLPDFLPDGLQPGLFFPILDQMKNVSGRISANAQLEWSAAGVLSSYGSFDLRDFSFTFDSIRADDLNVSLNIDNLLTIKSSPHQAMTMRHLDLGIPVENVLVYYQLKQADPLHIIIEKAQFSLMDGMVSVASANISPEGSSNLAINVSNFDLETLFNLIQIDGLSGHGHLNGRIPVTLAENQIVIKDGYLTAEAPGTLHFRSEKAAQYLASSGQEMNLLLQALQDFYYSELTLNLDKSADHGLTVKLSLLGNNPKVKNGQDFRLNIKLETELDKLLKAINHGYSLSNEILGGSFRFH